MGRIEEALRRAAGVDSAPDAPAESTEGVVSAPWAFGHEPRQPVPERPPRSRSVPSASPAADPGAWRFREFTADWRDRLVGSPSADPILVEQFRRLAATLHHAQTTSNIKVVMVTSAAPGDGKTMTAVNLSLVLSGSYGRRVLLIDADLRRPSLQALSQAPDAPGLSGTLKSATEQKLPMFALSETLMLLPAGRPDPDPMSGLTSPRMDRILEEAAERFDWVVLDAPPIGPVADASLLAAKVDAAVFVVRGGQTPYPAVQKAIEMLGRERILGVVLNGVSVDAIGNDRYYAEYRASRTD